MNNIEIDCYDVILNYYQNNTDTPEQRELWKDKAYLKLIEMWKNGDKNKEYIRNLFILLLNLFEDIPADIFDAYSNKVINEDKERKKKLISILKQEIAS